MKPGDIGRAIAYPLIAPAVLVPLVVFWLLISFAIWGGVLGLFLLFHVLFEPPDHAVELVGKHAHFIVPFEF